MFWLMNRSTKIAKRMQRKKNRRKKSAARSEKKGRTRGPPRTESYEGENETYIEASAEDSDSVLYDK